MTETHVRVSLPIAHPRLDSTTSESTSGHVTQERGAAIYRTEQVSMR
jgi:hypothetical protein